MSLINPFTGSLFAFLMVAAVATGFVFRACPYPTVVRMIVPTLLAILAVWTPSQVNALLGFPIETTTASLPSQVELVYFVPYDDDARVYLWLRQGEGAPRSYSVPMTDDLKETLRQAKKDREQGQERTMLAKVKPGQPKHSGVIDIDGGDAPYVLLPDAFSLPKKEPQQ